MNVLGYVAQSAKDAPGMGPDKAKVLGDDEAMRNMRHLGQSIAWLGKAMASVPDAFPIPPYNVELPREGNSTKD